MSQQDYPTYLAAQSMAATFSGIAVMLRNFTRIAVTAQWTAGTSVNATGVQSLEGSNDNSHWETLRDSSGDAIAFPADPAGAGAGTTGLVVSDVGFRYVRLHYVRTSGDSGATYSAQVFLT